MSELRFGTEFFVQWHLTSSCNLGCVHCYETGVGHDEMSTGQALEFIDQFAYTIDVWKEAVPSLQGMLHLTGGEPFLRDDLLEIAKYAIMNGVGVRILTNGTLITAEIAKALKEIGIHGVQVSIDGYSPKTHDGIRGVQGAFDKTVEGIRLLLRERVNTSIACTISKLNLREVHKIVTLALNLKANRVHFSRLVPVGRGSDLRDQLLTPEETRNVFHYLYSKQVELGNRLSISVRDPLFCLVRDTEQRHLIVSGCSIGLTGICLMPDGTLLPCRRLPLPLGSVLKKSLREIWVHSKLLNQLRNVNNLKGKCRTCEHRYQCRGCRAIAYGYFGDYLAEDPQCWRSVAMARVKARGR